MKKLLALFSLFLILSPVFAQSANDLFQQALVMERSEGNLQEAISLYERVVSNGSDRALAAKALVRIGENYERLGLRQARQAYQRVLDDYSEQQDTARIARERLALLLAVMTVMEPEEIDNGVFKRNVIDIPDNMGNVSPDGRYYSFVNWGGKGNVGIIDLGTGERTLINSDGVWGPTDWQYGDVSIWSPDSKELMYLWINGDDGEVRIYNRDTERTRVLVPSRSAEKPFPVKWSSDGNSLLAINEREGHVSDAITLVDIETGTKRDVIALADNWHTFNMDLSPDQRQIVYESFETGQRSNTDAPIAINILSSDGVSANAIVDNSGRNRAPLWDKTGKHVLYLCNCDDSTELWAQRVKNGKASGTATLVFSDFEGNIQPQGISDDGRYFYSSQTRQFIMYSQGVDFSSGTIHQNLRSLSSANFGKQRAGAISPNGELLAFISDEAPGTSSLLVTNLETGETLVHELDFLDVGRLQVTRQPLVWSRDNSSVLLWAGRNSIAEVNLRDATSVQVEDFNGLRMGFNRRSGYGYTSGESKIVASNRAHLLEVDLQGKTPRIIHEFEHRRIQATTTSPNGKVAAMIINPGTSPDGTDAIIVTVTIDEGIITELDVAGTDMGYSANVGISWTPDGKGLVFAENRPEQGQQLYHLDLESGSRTALGDEVFGDDQYIGVSVHPDGDKLTFFRGSERLQLWALEGIDL